MMPLVHQTLRGKLDLEFAAKRGKTRLIHSYQTPPLRVSRVLYMDGDDVATVYLVDTSGGMSCGDQNEIKVKVASSSTVHLITQSSTKIYPARTDNKQTIQSILLDVEDDASLYWHPETTIPYRDARFKQEIQVSLQPSSTVYYADILSPGRQMHNEKFQYDVVDTSIKFLYDGKCVAFDRQKLHPSSFSQNQLGLLDDYSYFGSAWFFKPNHSLAAQVQEIMSSSPDIRFAVTDLDPVGLHARWLSKDLCLLKESMEKFYKIITD